MVEQRSVPTDGELCPCGRSAVILIDGIPLCGKHKTGRVRKTIEWDQLSLLGEPPKRERASWLE